jgi:transcriptional regulator with XRE-family HTH domain
VFARSPALPSTGKYPYGYFSPPISADELRVPYRHMPRKLAHYLRTERRRAGLSQEDIAALLGIGALAIKRYEAGKRLPPLEAGIAFEVIFGVPVTDLFLGTYEEVRRSVRRRARTRSEHLDPAGNPRRASRRKESLYEISRR